MITINWSSITHRQATAWAHREKVSSSFVSIISAKLLPRPFPLSLLLAWAETRLWGNRLRRSNRLDNKLRDWQKLSRATPFIIGNECANNPPSPRPATDVQTFFRHSVHLRTAGLPPQVRPFLQRRQWRGQRRLPSHLRPLVRWVRTETDITVMIASLSIPAGYNNYSYLGYNTGMTMTGSAYNTTSSLATYGTAVLDPLLQASSLATAASAQTSSGNWVVTVRPAALSQGSIFTCEIEFSSLQLLEGNGWVVSRPTFCFLLCFVPGPLRASSPV